MTTGNGSVLSWQQHRTAAPDFPKLPAIHGPGVTPGEPAASRVPTRTRLRTDEQPKAGPSRSERTAAHTQGPARPQERVHDLAVRTDRSPGHAGHIRHVGRPRYSVPAWIAQQRQPNPHLLRRQLPLDPHPPGGSNTGNPGRLAGQRNRSVHRHETFHRRISGDQRPLRLEPEKPSAACSSRRLSLLLRRHDLDHTHRRTPTGPRRSHLPTLSTKPIGSEHLLDWPGPCGPEHWIFASIHLQRREAPSPTTRPVLGTPATAERISGFGGEWEPWRRSSLAQCKPQEANFTWIPRRRTHKHESALLEIQERVFNSQIWIQRRSLTVLDTTRGPRCDSPRIRWPRAPDQRNSRALVRNPTRRQIDRTF